MKDLSGDKTKNMMKNKLSVAITLVGFIVFCITVACSDSSSSITTNEGEKIVISDTLKASRDSLISDFNSEIAKLESKIDSLEEKIKAVGGNVDVTVERSKDKLISYKENLETQTDKIAAATDENWDKVKTEAYQEWKDFKSNVAETEKEIEEYFNTRTND